MMGNEDDLIHDLLYATLSRDANKVEELMQCGIDPCSPTKDGTSPIHRAALLESPAGPNIISRMLCYGADPNITTPTGLSPLHIAAMWGRVETLDVLLDSGADPSLKDSDDMSALDYTDEADENKEECIDALTRYRPPVKRKYSNSPQGYNGDVSENIGSGCESTFSDCFWSRPSSPPKSSQKNNFSTPNQSPINSPHIKDKNSRNLQSSMNCSGFVTPVTRYSRNYSVSPHHSSRNIRNSPKYYSANKSQHNCRSPYENGSTESKVIKCPISPEKNDSSLFVPLLPDKGSKKCDILLKISVVNGCPFDDSDKSHDSAFDNDFESNSAYNSNEQVLENYSNIPHHDESNNNCRTYIDLESQNTILGVDAEATVDYLNKSLPSMDEVDNSPAHVYACIEMNDDCDDRIDQSLSKKVVINDRIDQILSKKVAINDKMEQSLSKKGEINLNRITSPKQKTNKINLNDIDACNISNIASPKQGGVVKNSPSSKHGVNSNNVTPTKYKLNNSIGLDSSILDPNLSLQQTEVIEELAKVNVEYDWKDISDIGTASEFEESFIVPGSILSLSDEELRLRLKKAGETPGPISDTTRKLYQKHLTRLEKNNYRPLKPSDKYKDYAPEMRQILCESIQLSKEHGELLEAEMALKFTHPEKHTWREGSMKTSFNYLLLDPRVTNNLSERAKTMTYVEQLRVFMASIFYIGKGKNSRPYEHLFEAIKLEKMDKSPRQPNNKQRMIYDIWASGFGVVSLHVYHGVIPVEAYTREACMIEALGLARLTNAKSGDFYGDAGSWNGKKRRELGIYILSKAMEIYILEGERQIRQIDLVR